MTVAKFEAESEGESVSRDAREVAVRYSKMLGDAARCNGRCSKEVL